MALKVVHDKLDEIPEKFRELYEERDGKFVLIGIEGVKTQADIDRVQEALRKERKDHKDTKDKLGKFGDLNADEIIEKLDKLPELEAAAAAAGDPKKIDDLVNAKLASAKAPLERELKKLREDNAKLTEANTAHAEKDRKRAVHDAVREAAVKGKLLDTAVEDALMLAERVFEVGEDGKILTKDGVGVTPGITADLWLQDMQQKRPHWWAPSSGGGAKGGQGGGNFPNNPWSKDHWNLTEQGRMVNMDRAKAEQMAKAAGVVIGATRPAEPRK